MNRTFARALCALPFLTTLALAQDVIPLYPGPAPGSPQQQDYPEKEYFSKAWNTQVVSNITKPTLTVYKPAAGTANGSADSGLPRWRLHGPVDHQRGH